MKKDEQLEFDTAGSPSFSSKPARAGASRVFAHINDEAEWQTESSSNALSRGFIAVLALHVLVVAGILVHEMIKAKSVTPTAALPVAAAPAQTASDLAQPAAPAAVTPGPSETPAAVPEVAPLVTVETTDYTLKRNDTLDRVATANKMTVAELRELNKLGPSDSVSPGKTIKIPKAKTAPATAEESNPGVAATDGTKTHAVVENDTLFSIARKHGMTVSQLQRLNPSVNAKRLKKGMVLKLSK